MMCGKASKFDLCRKCEIKLNKKIIFEDNIDIRNMYFDEHIYLFKYEEIIRKLILNYKFNEKDYIYKVFIQILKNNKKIYCKMKKYDIIIPVPISKKRLKTRGFNQSALIGRNIADFLDVEYNVNVLVKIKNNNTQSSLNKEEREQNVKGVYSIIKSFLIKDKSILLVDDIYTTGSTVNECSKILKQNGAKRIGIFTVAKD